MNPQTLQIAINGRANGYIGLHQAVYELPHSSVNEVKQLLTRQNKCCAGDGYSSKSTLWGFESGM
jgi:hypothetical protein